MPVNRGPGVRQVGSIGTTPKEHRIAIAGQYAENAPGVPRSGLLVQANVNVVTPTAATAPMTYLVGEVQSVISRTVGEGAYTPTTVGSTVANRTVSTANAPASGSRWDLVWIKQNDQEKGDANNEAVIGVTSGAAAATPAKPTGNVPAGALILSEHQIFSGTTSTAASPNTTTQLWRHTASRGAPIPVRNEAERNEITAPAIAQEVVRLDVNGRPTEIWTGSAWLRPVQSGVTMVTTNAGGDASITFPIGFPNGLSSAVITDATPLGNAGLVLAKFTSNTSNRSVMTLRGYNTEGGVLPNFTFFISWIATGY